jgi:hypothetical protein
MSQVVDLAAYRRARAAHIPTPEINWLALVFLLSGLAWVAICGGIWMIFG